MRSAAAVLALLLWCVVPGLAQSTANPHGALPAGLDCADCHSAAGWHPLRRDPRFDHDKTGFALRDKHAAASCTSCHTSVRFSAKPAAPRQCSSCHTDVHQGRFSRDCASCHNSSSFNAARGPQAHARTNLPLTGAHASIPCESCHREADAGSFTALDTRCASCHQADYDRVTLPNHSAGRFSSDCAQCHNSLAWQGARFEHTSFSLEGPHASASCTECHRADGSGLVFPRPTGQQDCVACHRRDYDDEHAGSGFPTTCLTCHRNGSSWDDATFEHTAAANGFALLGAHIRATCGSCHAAPDGRLRFDPKPNSPQECAACHKPDYDREHTGSGFSTVCMSCHNVERWDGAVFDHTRFPLTGAHTSLPCTACHVAPNNALIYPVPSGVSDCVACHRADFDRQHTGSNFSTNCLTCHTNTVWTGATFDHASVARGFALLGKHTSLPCSSCHAPDGRALFTPAGNNDCVACHRADYDRKHTGSGFSTNCVTCHTNAAWTGATFDHASVARGFALMGKHASLPCSSCHAPDGRALFTPAGNNDCVTCHRADYDRKHTSSGFPTTCGGCHTQDTWTGASFNHDPIFPIYSGKHAGKWSTCQQCHTVPGDFRVFSCTTCHTRNKTDGDHNGVSGYAYDSNRCLSCHPRGDD